jgi:hypothetical protein
MSEPPVAWSRPQFVTGGGPPFLLYAVFSEREVTSPLSRRKYRSAGPPSGLQSQLYHAARHHEPFTSFRAGLLFEVFSQAHPDAARAVSNSPCCTVLSGPIEGASSLEYLRDTIGLVQFLLDQGGHAVYDPQMFAWWTPESWRREVFEPDAPRPRRHVTTLISREQDTRRLWLHTRGLRKFGRPDLSLRQLPEEHRDAAIGAFQGLIERQAAGYRIPENHELRVAAWPRGLFGRYGGSVDDPEFNNRHVAWVWPVDS